MSSARNFTKLTSSEAERKGLRRRGRSFAHGAFVAPAYDESDSAGYPLEKNALFRIAGMLELLALGAVEAVCLVGVCVCCGLLVSFAVMP
jgi:hypothetical protein